MSGRLVADVPATPHFDFLYGAFELGHWRIPYFSTTLSFSQAAENLKLAPELPGAETISWSIDELFQREIDWPRVENQIVPYLNAVDGPQFFNALTIALLPFNPVSGSVAETFDDGGPWSPPPLTNPERFSKELAVGPLTLGFWSQWSDPGDPGFQSGQVRWNPKEVFGVAIDGQHRLAAIKAIASGSATGVDQTRVPVILLVFDKRLGYKSPTNRPTVEVLRTLFIDLNKHAKTVSRARQILLDDRDPHAVAVRRLIGGKLEDHLNELNALEPSLPLALVDWHSEQAKFDDGPYLTTVLGLDWTMSKLLDTRPIGDYTDYSAVKKQVKALARQLGIGLEEAAERVVELENIELSPFLYSDADLKEIETAFGVVWSKAVVTILTEFRPYQLLINQRKSDGTLSLDFQNWYVSYKRSLPDNYEGRAKIEHRQLLGRLKSAEPPLSEAMCLDRLEKIRSLKANNLAFTVVFQRAYVEAFLEFAKIGDGDLGEFDIGGAGAELDSAASVDWDAEITDDDEPVAIGAMFGHEDGSISQSAPPLPVQSDMATRLAERAAKFVEIMNRVVDQIPEFLNLELTFESGTGSPQAFWLGTLRKPEGGVDFTQGASTRAKDLIFMVAAITLYDDLNEPDQSSDFDALWSEAVHGGGVSLCRRLGRAIKRFSATSAGASGRILRSRDIEYDEDLAEEEIYYRLLYIWNLLDL